MSRVAVIDGDEQVRERLAEALRAVGFQVVAMAGFGGAEAAGLRRGLDALLVDPGAQGEGPWALLEGLRRASATRSAAILLHTQSNHGSDRVRALRSGADDWIEKPASEEEVIARLRIALKRRSHRKVGLSGELTAHRLASLLQDLGQAGSTGWLTIESADLRGRIRLRRGCVRAAEAHGLAGQEGLETLLTVAEGSFRFVESPESAPGAGEEPELALNDALLDSAWVEEELAARRAHLPPPDARLEVVGRPRLPPEDLPALPAAVVMNRLVSSRARTLAELLAGRVGPPRRVELLIAWLVEQGILRALPTHPAQAPVVRVTGALPRGG